MNLSKEAKALVEDLGFSESDGIVMELKSRLYQLAAKSTQTKLPIGQPCDMN
jgi:hypothetical protein